MSGQSRRCWLRLLHPADRSIRADNSNLTIADVDRDVGHAAAWSAAERGQLASWKTDTRPTPTTGRSSEPRAVVSRS